MATRRRRKRHWLRTLLLFLFTPLIIWFLAFLLWFYWEDITDRFTKAIHKPARKSEKIEPPVKNKPEEKILDEERKKLEEIIKRQP